MNTKSRLNERQKVRKLGLLALTLAVAFVGALAVGVPVFAGSEGATSPQLAVATELNDVDVDAADEAQEGRSLIPGAEEAAAEEAAAQANIIHPTVDDLAIEGIQEIEVLLYKIFRSPDGYAALVGAGLSEDVPLPAMTEIQVPTGVEILWFGDIAGGPRSDDRQFPTPYDVRTENGFDIYTVITNYHVFQLEYLIDGEPFENLGSGDHSFNLEYTPLHDAAVLRLAAYLPAGSVVRDPSFTHLGFAPESDEPLYGITFPNVEGGRTYSAELVYGPPAAIARQGTGQLEGGILATIGIIIVALGAAAAVFFIARSRRQHEEVYEDYEEDWGGEEEHGQDPDLDHEQEQDDDQESSPITHH